MRTSIYLHKEDILQLNPCPHGVQLFDEFAALQDRKKKIRLTMTHLLWAACDRRTRGYLLWCQESGILPRLSLPQNSTLRHLDLSGALLRRASFVGADLMSANLTGANLEEAYFAYANLTGADLSRARLTAANLVYANLTGANLADANLRAANLRGAYLRAANLTGADLTGAGLTRANLTGAYRLPSDPVIPGWTLSDGVLQHAPRDAAVRLTIRRVPLNQGGYDRNGTYYGTGAPLFWYADDNGEIDAVVRAKDIEEAKAKALAVYPHATFKR